MPLKAGEGSVPRYEDLPAAYILVEGHRRFNMALYLQSVGKLNATAALWLMERP